MQDTSQTHDNGSEEMLDLDPDVEYPRLEGEEEAAEETEDELWEDEEEQPDLPDTQFYRDAVFNSIAFSWLTAALVKTLTMAPVEEEDICTTFREKVQTFFGRTRTVSSRSPSKKHVYCRMGPEAVSARTVSR